MLRMMQAATIAVSSSLKVGYGISSRLRVKVRGMPHMPCLLHNFTLFLFFNNYFAPFHSRSSYPTKSSKTQLHQLVKVTNLDHAFRVFDEMLQMRPLPSVVHFNQVLTQVAKLKHYSVAISLNDKMGLLGIRPNVYTLAIVDNCFCHLSQMGFCLSVLGKFFKLGFELNVVTFNTLINDFIIKDREVDAVGILNKMMEGGNCKPDVFTFNILAKGLCMKGNNIGAMQLLKRMEQGACNPDVVVFNMIINSLCKDTLVRGKNGLAVRTAPLG